MKKLTTKLIIVLAVVLLFVGTLCATLSKGTNTPSNDDPNYSNGITDGTTDGGSAEGGSADGGSAEGGSAEGGSAEGGSTEGGSTGAGDTTSQLVGNGTPNPPTPAMLPAYSGTPYVVVDGNIPSFVKSELTTTAYESYSELDALGRCGVAIASCGREIMPAEGETRGTLSSIYPTGWVQAQYNGVSGGYLWNRCHLIGWQLSAENANRKNLITGTRYMNVSGMLPFENMVADYIKETNNHVAFRVTPIFEGTNLVCSGVQIEAYSIEDKGDGIQFNVYCYNVQPGITIDYATGESFGDSIDDNEQAGGGNGTEDSDNGEMVWIPSSGTKYHSKSTCSNMKNPKQVTKEEAEKEGYEPCKKCH